MKKLLALAMLLVLCTVLTGLLTGCKVSVANTMMTDGVPKVAVTSPDVPVISTEWTERQYTVSEQDDTVLLTARYQIPVLTLTGSPDNSDTSYFSDYDKTVLDWIERSVFYNADGVTIVFNTYDIAPYSAGEQTFFIPYDLVKPYLNDYGLHLLELDT